MKLSSVIGGPAFVVGCSGYLLNSAAHQRGIMFIRIVTAITVVMAWTVSAWPCSVVGPSPSTEQLVGRAEVIVRAHAEVRAEATKGGSTPSAKLTLVRFVILNILKGRLSTDSIELSGTLNEWDDRNFRLVPYDIVRTGGRAGNCFATSYRSGGEYLLLLQHSKRGALAQPSNLTPYWAPLGPTNEQLFGGASDAWFVWVAQRAGRGGVPNRAMEPPPLAPAETDSPRRGPSPDR